MPSLAPTSTSTTCNSPSPCVDLASGATRENTPTLMSMAVARPLRLRRDPISLRIQPSLHGAALPQALGQGSGIDAAEDRQAFAGEPGIQRLAGEVVAEVSREMLRHQALHLDAGRLESSLGRPGRDTVVPHQRIRQDQDLAGVGRVGQRLDIPGHAGVEDDLARDCRAGSVTLAMEQ